MLSTFLKLQFVNKIFVLSIFVWPLKTGFTVIESKDLVKYSLIPIASKILIKSR